MIDPEDYKLAGEWFLQVRAIFIGESSEYPVALGDGGRAYGPGQHHPTFFAEYYGRSPKFPQSVTHTWTQAFIVATASFFELHVPIIGLDLTVQAYQAGVSAVLNDGVRNEAYLQRFSDNLNRIRGQVA